MSNIPVITKDYLKGKVPSNNIPLSVASPTRDLSSLDYVRQLVHQGASYQVIPSTQNPFNYNFQEIILSLLPQTKNILLDIALPFYNIGNQQDQGYYFGRYLIFDQRLIGVKLCCANRLDLSGEVSNFKKWPSRKIAVWKIHPAFLKFYKAQNFKEDSFKRQVKIGDFMLSFRNVRISLLFQSQIKQIQNVLDDCLQAGAEILSVVSDIPRDKTTEGRLRGSNYNMNLPIQNQLKQYARKNKKIVMLAGCRLAPLTELYLCSSFILHSELPQGRVQPHFLNLGGTLTVVCSIEANCNQLKKSQPVNIKGINYQVINECLPTLREVNPGKQKRCYPFGSKFYGPIPQNLQQILQKMHFWYIFHTIQQGYPLVIPIPLSQFTKNIVRQFIEISQYNESELKQYLIFYRTQSNSTLPQQLAISGVQIFETLNDLLQSSNIKKYFVYTQNSQEIRILSEKAENNGNIYVCSKALLKEEDIQKNKLIETIEKRIQAFADKIMEYGIYSLKKILQENKYSPQPLTKDQLLISLNENLKIKIRKSFRSHPFYRYILNKNRSELESALSEAEIQLHQEEPKGTMERSLKSIQESANISQQIENKETTRENVGDFFSKLSKMKRFFGNERKVSQLQCHRCEKYIFKSYVNECSVCKTNTCYFCFQAIKSRPSSQQAYKQCLVCKKLCFCDVCSQKKKQLVKEKEKIQASTEEIINLSINQPQKTLEELEDIRIQKEMSQNACQICQIQGRQTLYIKVICSKCDQKGCFNCIKAKEKGDRKFIKEWLCDKCKPPPPLRISQEMNVMTMIDEQAELDTPYNSPQPDIEQNNFPIERKSSKQGRQSNQQRKKSPQNSPSPPKQRNENKGRKRSPSQSNSPPKQGKKKPRSPSKSNSPPRKSNANNSKGSFGSEQEENNISKNQSKKRAKSPSNSASPPRKQKNSNPSHEPSPSNKQNISQKRPLSPSNSQSPPRKSVNTTNQEAKRSGSPLKKQNRPRSPSNSQSPPRQRKNTEKSAERSKSRSRSRSVNKSKRQEQNENVQSSGKALWGKKANQSSGHDKKFDRGERNEQWRKEGYKGKQRDQNRSAQFSRNQGFGKKDNYNRDYKGQEFGKGKGLSEEDRKRNQSSNGQILDLDQSYGADNDEMDY